MKLYKHNQGNLWVDFALVVADFAGAQVEEVFVSDEDAKTKEFKAKHLTGKYPLLETADGTLFESAAIARYIAGQNPSSGLLGTTAWERAQVDQWIDFNHGSLISHLRPIYMATFGWGSDADTYNEALKQVKDNIRVIHNALQGKEFLLGNHITVADIALATSLIIPFQVSLDPGFRKSVENVAKWFDRVTALPQFVKRFGKIKACAKSIKPVFPPKEEKKAAAPAKAAAKKDDDEEVVEKKAVNPLDVLPPTKFDLYNFKTYFVNEKDRRGAGMKNFLEQYDKEGYSIYFLHYDKYADEGQVIYKTSNLLNGFLQRIDHFRKHCFATHLMLGDEPNLEIEGVWMFRGKGIPQEMNDNPQMEYYKTRELSLDNEADLALITDFWSAKVGEKVNGQTVQEVKTHK